MRALLLTGVAGLALLTSCEPPTGPAAEMNPAQRAVRSVTVTDLGTLSGEATAPEHAPSASFTTITRHLRGFTIPWTQEGFVSCTNGGAGEKVHLTGEYHWFINFTGNEKWQVSVIGERVKLTGVGEVTGDAYRFHQVSHSVTNIVRASGLNIGKRWITRGFLQAERGGPTVYLKDTLVFRLDVQGNPIVDFRHTEFACR